MIRTMLVVSTALLLTVVSSQSGMAWMRGGGGAAGGFHGAGGGSWQRDAGGGFTHSGDMGGAQHSTTFNSQGVSHESDMGGFAHGTTANSQGVAHASDAGGYEHGTEANGSGVYHSSDYGGYYHSTTASGGTVSHTGYNGTTTESSRRLLSSACNRGLLWRRVLRMWRCRLGSCGCGSRNSRGRWYGRCHWHRRRSIRQHRRRGFGQQRGRLQCRSGGWLCQHCRGVLGWSRNCSDFRRPARWLRIQAQRQHRLLLLRRQRSLADARLWRQRPLLSRGGSALKSVQRSCEGAEINVEDCVGCRCSRFTSTSGAFAQSAAAKNVLNSCKPDIARFCSAVLPGDGRIKGCMKQHLPELSEGCKEALFQAWLRQ